LNKEIKKFCSLVALESKSTARQYSSRLDAFDSFLAAKFGLNIEGFFEKIKEFDIYDVMADFHFYLRDEGLSPSTIAGKIATVKMFLEYNSIPISNTVFRLRVRAPRRTRNLELEALSKDLVRKILLEIKNMRLQTYVLLLASTGMRANEGLSIRFMDVDWDNKKILIRKEYTKTRHQRYALLTEECIKQLKNWKEYRERERKIVLFGGKYSYKIKKPFKPEDLLFTTGHHKKDSKNPYGLYSHIVPAFSEVLEKRLGLTSRHENLGNRHKITLHSFRRFVKSTISDLGYQDYSEWFIGHIGSTYYRKTEAEKLEIFKKVEPYLTYLDYSQLEAKGADTETKLEQSEKEIESLKQEVSRLKSKDNDLIKELADRLDYLESKLGTRD
jgi:integrase